MTLREMRKEAETEFFEMAIKNNFTVEEIQKICHYKTETIKRKIREIKKGKK